MSTSQVKSGIAVSFGLALAAGVALFSCRAQAADKSAPASKLDLTPTTFPTLRTLIRPHANEWRHLKVEWLTDVVAARKRAAAEDKPIIICYTGGAGYNEPLGVC
jgi:hypothetical protein